VASKKPGEIQRIITDRQKAELVRRVLIGDKSMAALGREYGISRQRVFTIVNNSDQLQTNQVGGKRRTCPICKFRFRRGWEGRNGHWRKHERQISYENYCQRCEKENRRNG